MSKIVLTTAIELDGLEVTAEVSKHYPATRWQPEEPSSIEDIELSYKGVKITGDLLDKILEEHNDNLEDEIWAQAEAEAEETAIAYWEHMRDLKESR